MQEAMHESTITFYFIVPFFPSLKINCELPVRELRNPNSQLLESISYIEHMYFLFNNMLQCYLKSIYMLDCIRIAMLGINI